MKRSVLNMAVGVVAGCVAGIVAALLFTQSPEQAATERAVPVLPVVSVPVVSQRLTDLVEVLCVQTPELPVGRLWQCRLPDGMAVAEGESLPAVADGEPVSAKAVRTVLDEETGEPSLILEVPRGLDSTASLEATVVIADTEQPVLTVPAGAVWSASAGEPVLRLVEGELQRELPVQTGIAANGWVEVRGDGLKAGLSVMIRGAE